MGYITSTYMDTYNHAYVTNIIIGVITSYYVMIGHAHTGVA